MQPHAQLTTFRSLTAAFLAIVAACSSPDEGMVDDTETVETELAPGEEHFKNGSTSLQSQTLTQGDTKVTTVVDETGQALVEQIIDEDGVTLRFPNAQQPKRYDWKDTLSGLPGDFAANRLAVFVAAQVKDLDAEGVRNDAPGCDWFPDTQCTLGCCARHDQCYAKNNCTARSWLSTIPSILPGIDTDACDNCNAVAASCIIEGCKLVECLGAAALGAEAGGVIGAAGAGTACAAFKLYTEVPDEMTDRCFDNRCGDPGTFYNCPDKEIAGVSIANCDCASPCDQNAPTSCGDGSCDHGETKDNCNADCGYGSGFNACCVKYDGCPGETADSCGDSGCCCCGDGTACTTTMVCG